MSKNSFSYPFYTGTGSGLYGGVLHLTLGQTVTIAWQSNLDSYELALYHQLLDAPEGSGVQAAIITSYNDDGSGSVRYSWNVSTYDTDFTASPVYFLWANPGPNGFTSSYFNITNSALASTSSFIGSSTSTSTRITSSGTLTTATTTSATSTTSTNPISNTTVSSPSSSNTLSIGLGVGLGLGIPLLLVIGILLGILIVKSQRRVSQSSSPEGAPAGEYLSGLQQTKGLERKGVEQSGYQVSQPYSDTYSPQAPELYELYVEPVVYEAPSKDNGRSASPVEIGGR